MGRAVPLFAGAFLLCAASLSAASAVRAEDYTPPPPAGTGASGYELDVAQGKSEVLQTPGLYTDLMIADPKIADVVPLTSHSVYVVGKSLGSTALSIYGPGKRLIAAINVVVGPDITGLTARLHEVAPSEHDIAIRASAQSLIVSGTVSSPVVLHQILQLAEAYAPGKVINMMAVEGTQQVMLSVRFVEMDRSTAKSLSIGVNRTTTSGNPQFNFNSLIPAVPGAGVFGVTTLAFNTPDGSLSIQLDALETRGVVKTLAEPTLVAMSGDTASFLAGGEFPYPSAQNTTAGGTGGSAAITVAFQQFGISLGFTPTILQDGMINLVVKPEVSSLDQANGVSILGTVVPGLKVRRASTTVELRDGESFTIAGLLGDNYSNTINAFPILGDVPVLGALFRSPQFQHDQTELVIVVTPHLVVARRGPVALPTDHYTPPSDYELFLFGMLAGEGSQLRPEDRALMSQDPAKGGVEGPYGHVLY
ncbi:MAG TPA: type II and III secretion system protein family protein [Caulobacteraceae bacterium]|nr:type II and III secretion system protein family protein [Caulobacteraceae bacterium]